jgi:hypothetical protein
MRMRDRPRSFRRVGLALIGAVIAVAPLTVAQAQTATFDPTSGPPGTTVTAEAFGFQPDEVVELRFAGETLATGEADPEGFVRLTGTVPQGVPAGSHPMTVVGAEGTGPTTMFQVTEAAADPTPAESSADQGSGDQGGTGEQDAGETREQRRPGAAAAASEEDTSAWVDLLVGLLVVILGGALLMPASRGPVFLPPEVLFIGWLWDALFGDKEPTGPVAVGPCPVYDWVRTAAGSLIRVTKVEKTGTSAPCKWTVDMEELHYYYRNGHACTLTAGHTEPHLFAQVAGIRDPAPPQNYIDRVRTWDIEIVDEHCTKGSGGVRHEAEQRYRRQQNRVMAGPGGVTPGQGGTDPLNQAPCKVCGEPRGNKSPCPHCGMD